MKIKVIDLLNMISKGEEVPKKICYEEYIWTWNGENYDNKKECLFEDYIDKKYVITEVLTDEIEIIEEDKEIEDIDKEMSKLQSEIDLLSNEIGSYHNKIHSMRDRTNYMKETLKDLQKVVNGLRKGYNKDGKNN